MITYEQIKADGAIRTYITKADESLGGARLHGAQFCACDKGRRNSRLHSDRAWLWRTRSRACEDRRILTRYRQSRQPDRTFPKRRGHAFRLLDHMDMSPEDIATVVTAIGNHDEGTGVPVNEVAAALILADKSDVRRSRVRNTDPAGFDIHDRVNYSVKNSLLKINTDHTKVKLKLDVDTHYSSVMDYFEIFMDRMILCRKAAAKLGLEFKLIINEQQLI